MIHIILSGAVPGTGVARGTVSAVLIVSGGSSEERGAVMEWTEDLAVGIESIDRQHQELFRRINGLLAAIKERRCKSEIDGTIQFLDDYARFHFAEEEARMREASYDGLADHQERHKIYLANIAGLKELAARPRISGMTYELSVTTNQVVVDWIADHIMQVDRMFGAFMKGRGKG